MPNLTALTTNFFPTPNEGFTTTISGPVDSSSATVVPLNSVSGLTNGSIFTGLLDPGNAKERAFTGVVDTAGSQITSVKFTTGTNATHTTGATVVDYVTGTHVGQISKGITQEHGQSGAHSTTLITARTEDTNPDHDEDFVLTYDTSATALKKVKMSNLAGAGDAWVKNALPAVSSVTENGNRSADITFASTVASILTPGMRLRTSRTVAAPTQCADLESSSSQYFSDSSVSGMTFTDDFTAMAWVKLESYTGSNQTIISRFNGTTGWGLRLDSSGRVSLFGKDAGTSDDNVSYQSIPLNKWVHVAATLDISASANSKIYIDGVEVPATYTNGTSTTVTQAGNLNVGALNAAEFFDGKIAQAAVFSSVLSASTIRSYKNQTLSGSETNLVSAYSFNNTINDLNTGNANNLTANGGALATNADSPFTVDANGTPGGTYDWAIVTKVATTVATVQYPEGCAIPTSGGISAVDYSGVKAPFGMPTSEGRWVIKAIYRSQTLTAINNTTAQLTGAQIVVPVGEWNVGEHGQILLTNAGRTNLATTVALSTSTSTLTNDLDGTRVATPGVAASSSQTDGSVSAFTDYTTTSQTTLYLDAKTTGNDTVYYASTANASFMILRALLAYI